MSSSRSVRGKNKVGENPESDPLLKLVDDYEDGEFCQGREDEDPSEDLEENEVERRSIGEGAFVRIFQHTQPSTAAISNKSELPASQTSCCFSKKDLSFLEAEFRKFLPKGFSIVIPSYTERATDPPAGCQAFYEDQFSYGLRIPFIPLVRNVLNFFSLSPAQLLPHSVAYIAAFSALMEAKGKEASFSNFWQIFRMDPCKGSNMGFVSIRPRSKRPFLTKITTDKSIGWKRRFFFVKGPDLPMSEGSSKTRPYRWDGANTWTYGSRRIKEKLSHRLSDELLEQLQSNPYQTRFLIQEGVLRLAGLSHCNYPTPAIKYPSQSSEGSLLRTSSAPTLAPLSLGRVVEKFRVSAVGPVEDKRFYFDPLPYASERKADMSNFGGSSAVIPSMIPDLRGVGTMSSLNSATAGPLRTLFSPDTSALSSVGYSQHSWNRIQGIQEYEKLLGQKRNAEHPGPSRRVKPFSVNSDSVPCREGRSEPDVADFMDEHFRSGRTAGYPEDGTILTDLDANGENEFDKAARIFMAGRFKRDMLLHSIKGDFEVLSDFSRTYHEVGDLFALQTYRLALLEQESQDAHDAYAQIFSDNQILRSQLAETQRELSQVKKELNEATMKRSSSVEEDLLASIKERSALEEELKKVKIELELAKQDSERAYAQGREEAEIPSIRGFLESPVLNPLVQRKMGEILQTIFYKGVQQLVAAKKIPDDMDEYFKHMNPFKNAEGKDYNASSLPKMDSNWQDHRFAPLVEEYGIPMPNPDVLDCLTDDPPSMSGEKGGDVDMGDVPDREDGRTLD